MMFMNSTHFGNDPSMFSGIVVDRADPQQRGRVRVRIFGLHGDLIPDNELPWSVVLQSVNSAALSGVGIAPTGLMLGSIVVVTFMDGRSQQQPMVMGTLGQIEATSSDGIIAPGGIQTENAYGSGYTGPESVSFAGDGPKWLQIATAEIGTQESQSGNNPRVVEYARTNGFSDDETAWCSSFVKWVIDAAGLSTAGVNGLARSWTRASCVTKLDKPLYGAIVVLSRGSDPNKGHVGFLKGIQGGKLQMLGGNQGGRSANGGGVNIRGYNSERLVGFYWPNGAPQLTEYEING